MGLFKIADHPDTDFKIREFSGKPIEGGDYGWFAYTFQQMPVILLMRIDFNKKNVTLLLMTLKEMLVLLGVENSIK